MRLGDAALTILGLVLGIINIISLIAAIYYGIKIITTNDWRDAVLNLAKFIVFSIAFIATKSENHRSRQYYNTN